MDKITIDGLTYTVDEKTLNRYKKKLEALKKQDVAPLLAVAVSTILMVTSIWTLGYQTILWLKTGVWSDIPWYKIVFNSEPPILDWVIINNIFQYLASVNLWIVLIILTPIAYTMIEDASSRDTVIRKIASLEEIVRTLQNALYHKNT